MTKAKPFDIPKREVWEAFKKVKANQGAAGVDGQSIADFEIDLKNNLYRLWNRLSSGSYLPRAVRRVDIPKAGCGTRPLGIPTVTDRIAQEVVRRYLEPRLDPLFHADSYGYRPGRSAIDAVRTARLAPAYALAKPSGGRHRRTGIPWRAGGLSREDSWCQQLQDV
jgi:RNA-directed DNA polymerase